MNLTETDEHVTDIGLQAARLRIFPVGTVLLAMYGSIGTTSVAAVPTTTNQAILGIQCGADLDPEYLWFYLTMMQPRLASTGRGGTQSNVNATMIRDMEIPARSVAEQRRIAAELKLHIDEATKLRQSLQAVREVVQRLSDATRRDFMERLPDKRVPIGSIVSTPGAIIDGPFGSNLKGDHYKSSGVRVIRLGNIGLGRFVDMDRAFVTQDHADHLRRHRADAGDVVVAALGDGVRPAGRACLVPPGLGPSIVKADCFRVRTNGSGLDAAFLMHAMNSPQMLAIIQAATRGATRPRMNLEMLKNLEVPIPALDEQRRLAAELDERLAVIGAMDASLRGEQQATEALSAALLRRAFEDRAA